MAQPPPSRLSPKGLLALPYRLCNPPPAIGKVRSCSFTPVLDVRLDDVLARRHLPPIGLKDLEEYLLYVERTPENLYFILWLKDYTARYHTWAQREKISLVRKSSKTTSKMPRPKFSVPPTPDPSLAMFYLRAKQTFFTPNGQYELNVPADVLSPFHTTHTHRHQNRSSLWHSQSIHPDPAVFAEVAIEVRNMLDESLHRFVRAAYTNVGSGRAICGIIAGCVLTFAAGLLPLVLTTGRWNVGPHGRLMPLVAFPGLWLGLTILVASLQGICLMVYIFGDLRQLRKFELSRPTISRPIPMSISPPTPFRSTRVPTQPLLIPPRAAFLPERSPGASSSLESPVSFTTPSYTSAHISDVSLARTSSRGSCESDARSSIRCNEIDVSPAFFDDVPAPEGPATASCLHRPEYRLSPPAVAYLEPAYVRPERSRASHPGSGAGSPADSGAYEFGPTAGFIPTDYSSSSSSSLSDGSRSPRNQNCFDFDLLPLNLTRRSTTGDDRVSLQAVGGGEYVSGNGNGSGVAFSAVVVDPNPYSSAALSSGPFLGRAQYKCNQRPPPSLSSPELDKDNEKWASTSVVLTSSASSPARPNRYRYWLTTLIPSFTAGVPVFAAPLTEVRSSVVKRAQWEVVVRAAIVAALMTGALIGVVVGIVS